VAAQKKKAQGEYDAAQITILEGLEAVRKRPSMYIGSTGERGLHHLIWEVVDNAVDEAMAGYATTVDVVLLEDGGVEVADNGRGIPVAMHASGEPTVDVVMTQLHAGGKFDSGAYAISGGLHGVGVSVVNALSTRLEVEIKRDGYEWSQRYEQSVPVGLKQGAPTKKTGSTVRFWADPNVFETTEYDFETVARRLQEMAFLNKGLTINLTDQRVTQDEVVEVSQRESRGNRCAT
jgi:DNA gyrase subunit B